MGLEVVVEGLAFAEGPRWHDGRLWYSDMHRRVVEAVDLDGAVESIVEVPGDPSGLGWLPDGRLLVVSMRDRTVQRLEPDGSLVTHAELWDLASFHCNDMVVDRRGRAYVGNFGFDLHGGAKPAFGELILVEPDGSARVVADRMKFPNGTVITPDEATLIVGQSTGRDLVTFDIADDGSLENRRVWADLGAGVPDGICLDAEGAIWYADPEHGGCHRVAEGGEVLDVVETDRLAFACMLGGPQRRHLFVLTSTTSSPQETTEARTSRIEVVEVAVPGVGWP
jgi:sugar lactone lactonase YvrE